jgi:hypothetical protein
MSTHSVKDETSFGRPRAPEAILYGGLAVSVLDGLAASANAAVRGTSPFLVWQYVASGLLGQASFQGGWATCLLGILVHVFVAFAAATVYYLLSLKFPVLIRRPVLCGVIYGVAVQLFMGRVVVPLSAARVFPFAWSSFLTAVAIHILFVGLPIALLARRSAGANREAAAV